MSDRLDLAKGSLLDKLGVLSRLPSLTWMSLDLASLLRKPSDRCSSDSSWMVPSVSFGTRGLPVLAACCETGGGIMEARVNLGSGDSNWLLPSAERLYLCCSRVPSLRGMLSFFSIVGMLSFFSIVGMEGSRAERDYLNTELWSISE